VLFAKYYVVIKWSRMRWTENVALKGALVYAFKVLVGNPEGKRLGVDGRTILNWIVNK
jgi:hypothetical protein